MSTPAIRVARWTARFPHPELAVSTFGFEVDEAGRRLVVAALPEWSGPLTDDAVITRECRVRGLACIGGNMLAVSGDRHTVETIDCAGGRVPSCLAGFDHAAGLAVDHDGTLLVVDTARGTVDDLDVATGRLLVRWGGLDRPQDVTVLRDAALGDIVLVVDADGVRRLDREGRAVLVHPVVGARSIAVDDAGAVVVGTDTSVLSLDASELTVAATPSIADTPLVPGSWATAHGPHADPRWVSGLTGPFLVSVVRGRLHVSAPTTGRVRVIAPADGSVLGESGGTVLGLTTDHRNDLWAADPTLTRRIGGTVLPERATAVVGPFSLIREPGVRDVARIRARGDFGTARATVTARFLDTAGAVLDAPEGGPWPWTTEEIGTAPPAIVGATDSPDLLVHVPAGTSTAVLEVTVLPVPAATGVTPADLPGGPAGTGAAPWVDLVELRLDDQALIDELPQVYRARGAPEAFLDPFLRLLATGLDEITDTLVELPTQFDPATATDDLDGDRWLDWLSTWVDAPLGDRWEPSLRRRVVAEAFRWHGRRGTPAALRRQVAIEHGVDVTIDEQANHAHVWVLGEESSELGRTTMTTAAPAEGAVLDRNAVLDRAHLIGPNDRGAPLFGDLAHRFTVLLPVHASSPARRAAIAATVEREKPAHTHAHVCVRPSTVIGASAVVGLRTVVGPGAAPSRAAHVAPAPDPPPPTAPAPPPPPTDRTPRESRYPR